MKSVLFAVLLLCAGVQAHPQSEMKLTPKAEASMGRTGADFLQRCSGIDSPHPDTAQRMQAIACVYYIQGVADGFDNGYWQAAYEFGDPKPNVCIPESLTMVDLAKAVMATARKDATYRQMNTRMLIYSTLIIDYPCK